MFIAFGLVPPTCSIPKRLFDIFAFIGTDFKFDRLWSSHRRHGWDQRPGRSDGCWGTSGGEVAEQPHVKQGAAEPHDIGMRQREARTSGLKFLGKASLLWLTTIN